MTWSDLTIIYLACGAPFGVYFYLNRKSQNASKPRLIFFSIINFIFWLPLSIYFFIKEKFPNVFSEPNLSEDSKKEKLRSLIKQFEKFYFETNPHNSIFEFREVLERYAGLTISMLNSSEKVAAREKEVFRISGKSNNELSAVCLNRRNRKRLYFHQNSARLDFLQLFNKLITAVSDKELLGNTAKKFVELLNDETALDAVTKTLAEISPQTEKDFSVRILEKDLWTPEIQKQPSAKQSSVPLQTLTATLNSSTKD